MNIALNNSTSKIDWLGMAMSTACAVHCLLMPLLLPVLVTLKLGFLGEESFEHWAWNITFGLCLLITVYQFAFKHKHGSVFIPLAIGFGLMMNKGILGESGEPYIALIAGLLLALTHFLNLKMCKFCPKCQSKE